MDSHSFSFHYSEPHPHNLNNSLTQDSYQRPSSSLYPELSPINSQQYPSQVLGDAISSQNQQGDQGYLPPDQYPSSNSEQEDILRKKVQSLEKRLDEGWYIVYKVWLTFLYFVGGFGVGYFGAGILSIMGFYGKRALGTCAILSLFFFCSVWIIKLAWKERSALTAKEWKLARDGLISMVFFAVFYLTTILAMFWFLNVTKRKSVHGLEANKWLWIAGYIIPMFINIFGAKKVCKLFQKRDEVLAALYTRQIYNV